MRAQRSGAASRGGCRPSSRHLTRKVFPSRLALGPSRLDNAPARGARESRGLVGRVCHHCAARSSCVGAASDGDGGADARGDALVINSCARVGGPCTFLDKAK